MNSTARPRRADDTAQQIRTRILQGRFPAGSALPPERSLADELGVSRLTLRSALARLQSEGLVESVHGSGNRVLDFRRHGGIDLLTHLVGLSIADGEIPLELFADLLEVRRMVAIEVVGLVAERADKKRLAALRTAVDELAKKTGDAAAFMAADLQFARVLVFSAGNLALELLLNSIIRMIEEQPGIELAFGL